MNCSAIKSLGSLFNILKSEIKFFILIGLVEITNSFNENLLLKIDLKKHSTQFFLILFLCFYILNLCL